MNSQPSTRPAQAKVASQPVGRRSRLLALALVGLLGGCAVQPPKPTAPVFDANLQFSGSPPPQDAAVDDDAHWWLRATDPGLGGALNATLESSPAVRLADADVDAANARLRRAGAERGPSADASAGIGVRKTTGQERTSNRSLGVDADLPIDASGALAERERAARADLDAAMATAAQTRSDVARDLLLAAIDVAEARQRYVLLEQQVDLAAQLLRLIELRFTQGLAGGVDVLQQRDQLAALRQQLPVALLDAARATNALRARAGQAPGAPSALALETLPTFAPGYPPVQPVELLQRRGGLRAARARLVAADADYAAALADRWPEVSLSAGVLNSLVAGNVSNLVAATLDATLVLFDGGRLVAIADERRAALTAAGEQLLIDWFAIVLDADTLIHEHASLLQRLALSSERLETAEALLRATQQRYERGVSDYLPVLEALRGLQQQQRDHLALRAALDRTRVRLHHALGDTAPTGTTQ